MFFDVRLCSLMCHQYVNILATHSGVTSELQTPALEANMARQARLTSITEKAAHDHIAKGSEREALACTQIPGFHLVKLKKGGAWRWRYQDKTGARRTATIGSYHHYKPNEAAEIVLEWKKEKVDPLTVKKTERREAVRQKAEAEQRTLGNYLSGPYAKHMTKWGREASKLTDGRIRKHFASLLERDMATICKADVRKWQDTAVKNGATYTTLRRTFGALRALLSQAVDDEVIDCNPLKGVKLDPPTHAEQSRIASDPGKEQRRLLTDGEVQGLHKGLDMFAQELREQRRNSRKHGKPHLPDLDAVEFPHWFIPFCLVALHTGLRPGDVRTLTWAEVNLTFARLICTTNKSLALIRKGSAPAVVNLKINDQLLAVLRAWHKQQGEPQARLVFPSPKTSRELDRQSYEKPWARVKELGGLPQDLHFYALRHHYVSSLIVAGYPLFTIAKMVGHKSPSMIEKHYGHLLPAQADEAVDIVAQSLARARARA